MSKFFNDTRSVGKANPVPATANVDIQELVGSLKQSMESNGNGSTAQHSGEINLQQFLPQPLKESHEVGSQVAEGRLENCRSIRLPRTEERSFLVTQYNPAMQAAVEAYRTLRTRLVKQQTRTGARSMVVTSSAQGEGKTLTIFNLALCYAKIENWPVLVVDADLRTRGLSILAGDPESPGLAEILKRIARINPLCCGLTYPAFTFCRLARPRRHRQSCFPARAGKSLSAGRLNHSAWCWLTRLRL